MGEVIGCAMRTWGAFGWVWFLLSPVAAQPAQAPATAAPRAYTPVPGDSDTAPLGAETAGEAAPGDAAGSDPYAEVGDDPYAEVGDDPYAEPEEARDAEEGFPVLPAQPQGPMDEYGETNVADPPVAGGDAEGRAFRMHSSLLGPVGGVHLVDAGAGLPESFRVQLALSYFSTSDLLLSGDTQDQVGGALSFSWTINDFLEVFGAIENHASSNSRADPVLLQVLGDTSLGVKGFHAFLPWLALGADLRAVFLNAVGDIGLRLASTNLGLRVHATADLRERASPLPLIVRMNLGYTFDNSAQLITEVEDGRREAFGEFDERAFISRVERFGLGIDRVDRLDIGLGLEVPLRLGSDLYLHPLVEWTLGLPIDRQGYTCLESPTSARVGDPDGCLALVGFAAVPSNLTFGVRLWPPLKGLSLLLAVDAGLSGTARFVRELAPNPPYNVRLAVAYAYDTRAPRWPEHVPEPVVAEAAPRLARIDGVVVERGLGASIAGAVVRYPGMPLSPQLSDEGGRFVSYGFQAGTVTVEVSHPGYETQTCVATVPARAPTEGPAAEGRVSALEPVDERGAALAPAPKSAVAGDASAAGGVAAEMGGIGSATDGSGPEPVSASTVDLSGPRVDLRCELAAKPNIGTLSGTVQTAQGEPITGASIALSGPEPVTLTSDVAGVFRRNGLPAGDYTLKVEAAGYPPEERAVRVERDAPVQVQVVLDKGAVPARARVTRGAAVARDVEVARGEVRVRGPILFNSNSAEISDKSLPLLREVAAVLASHPEVQALEIQGHTDNEGEPQENLALSQQRAEAVRARLIEAGVSAVRLTAKGYGDTRPIVPNLTPKNRAINRRVQFIIRKRAD